MQGRAGRGGCISSSLVVVAMLASCSSCGSMGGCRDSCYRDNGHLPSVRACSGPTDPTHGAGRPHCPNSWCRAETIWCRADARDHLRLRGGKGCRSTQPAKVSEQCSTKQYQADCAPMPFLIGIHISMLPQLKAQPMEEVVMVDLDRGRLRYNEKDIQHLPDEHFDAMVSERVSY